MITIDVANQQSVLPVDEDLLRRAVEMVLGDESISVAQISVAVVDDPTIHRLNVEYLNHDYATDVLSFLLERSDTELEGEIIVSADTALQTASQFDWSASDELLLYVIHGALHLVGWDDQTPAERVQMQERERTYLARFGLEPSYEDLLQEEQ